MIEFLNRKSSSYPENTVRLPVYNRNSMLTEYFSRLVRAVIHGITIMKRRKILPKFSTDMKSERLHPPDPMIRRYSRDIMQTEKLDPLSELPEPIIHHIMSYLSPKDAVRISVLSKRFESAWTSFPFICLDETLYMGACKAPGLNGMLKSDKFLRYVKDFLLRRQPDLNLEKFCFRVSLYKGYHEDEPNNTIIDRAIIYAIENNVKVLELDLFGRCCDDFVPSYRLPMEVFSAKSVTVLNLKGFHLESPSQDHLTLDHPLMKNLVVEECKLMKTLKVSGRKLSSLVIDSCWGLERIEIDDAKNLESFSFDGTISADVIQSCEIDITAPCKSLKILSLKRARITDEWIKSQVPKFLLLQVLKLHSCKPVRNLHVSCPTLKRMELNDCNQLEEVEIHARKLHTFVYRGDLNLSQLFIDSACLHAKLSLSRDHNVIDNEWYSRLRDFLARFDHCQELEIGCNSNKALIVPTELRDSLLSPLYDLEHLKLEISPELDELQDLVESLLWLAPHPSTISFVSGSEEKSLKFEYDIPQIIEEDLYCCFSRPIKCWRHHLKWVTTKNFEVDEMKVMQNFITKQAMRLEAAYDNPKQPQEISEV